MNRTIYLCTGLSVVLLLLPAMLFSQDTRGEDPFKRDPLFTKPLHEFFNNERDVSSPDTGENMDEGEGDIRRYVRSINEEGIDFEGGLEAGPYHSNPLFNQFPNLPMIHYNRVNGLFLGLKKERMQWYQYNNFLNIPGINPHGFFGYGTASRNWEYALGAEKLIGKNRYFMIGGEIHDATTTDDYWRVGLIESSFTSFFASYDFPDYYRMKGFGAYMVMRSRRYIEFAASYNIDEFSSLQQNTGFSMFGRGRHFTQNRPIDPSVSTTDIERFNLSMSFNPRKLILLRHFTFSAKAFAELGDNQHFDNEFPYNKYLGEVIFYLNLEPGSMLKWRLRSGSITGEAPMFRQFQLGGIGSLRATPYKSLQGNQMVLSNIEVHFGSDRIKRNPWIDFSNIHLLLFLDSGWAQHHEELTHSGNLLAGFGDLRIKDMTHDAGIGLGSGLLRFELAWPVNSFDQRPTLWVRFNPTF